MSQSLTNAPTTTGNRPSTQTRTRIDNPLRKNLLRAIWIVAMTFNVVLFIAGFGELIEGTYARYAGVYVSPDPDGIYTIIQTNASTNQAGVRVGDKLLAIDGIPYADWTPSDPTAESAVFTLQTPGQPPRDVVLTRTLLHAAVSGGIQLGLPEQVSRIYFLISEAVLVIVCVVVALLIFALRSDDWMALYIAWALVIAGLASSHAFFNVDLPRVPPNNIVHVYGSFAFPLAMLAALYFPVGELRPRWSWIPVLVYALGSPLMHVLAQFPIFISFGLPNVLIMTYVAGVIVWRYRHEFTPIQRQQTKWVMFGLMGYAGAMVIRLSIQVASALLTIDQFALYDFFTRPLEIGLLLVLPVGFAFSILRYRLWDVDVVINRSLVGGIVTVIVIAIYAAAFLLIKPVIESLFGQESSLPPLLFAAVISGALFTPIRRSVRHIIDRRLYGLRFDLNQVRRAHELAHAHVQAHVNSLRGGAPAQPLKTPGVYSGQTLNGWRLRDMIGRGGMGEVYQAEHSDGRIAAVKILPADLMLKPEFTARFEREARTLQSLDHPNIVKVWDVGIANNISFIAMEYIDGDELGDLIRRDGALDPLSAAQIVRDVADALDYAHARGLVHRDIKPSNIMIRRQTGGKLRAVLMDFGIAKIQDTTASFTRYTGSNAVGTIDYMAPEQIMTAREVDHRADIYALGVVLYEMLTGERPFKGSAAQVLFAHVQQPAPDPRTLKSDLPRALSQVVMRALEKDAANRYASAGAMASEMI